MVPMLPTSLYQLFMVIHFIALGGLVLYGLHRLWLISCWLQQKNAASPKPSAPVVNSHGALPRVTVQLPIYNERFVAARLIEAVAKLDWPTDRFQVQILDDSSDDTKKIIDQCIESLKEKNIDFQLIRRTKREGFKAGALSQGLKTANGELIAVFDADFIPPADFLRRSVPWFHNPQVGMVQARWSFVNADNSWLTRVQALLLGPHFGIEHQVRCSRGLFFNFNGTAGIWRKQAIVSAGGWQSDTLTEDLDLSYRAQLQGWQFVYLDDLTVPSELPATLSAFRSQQVRWAKGSIQTAKKVLPTLIRSTTLPIQIKAEAVFHLLANLGWLCGALITITLFPTIIWRVGVGFYQLLRIDIPLFFGGCGAIMLYFLVYALYRKQQNHALWIAIMPILSIGMAPSLALAVLDGALRKGGHFQRTPKFGILGQDRLPGLAFLYHQGPLFYLGLNFTLFLYSLLPVYFALQRGTWLAAPFLLMFSTGFLMVILKEIIDRTRPVPHG